VSVRVRLGGLGSNGEKMQLKPIEINGRFLVEIAHGIYLIENFITNEEHSYLLNVCKTADEYEWTRSYMDSLREEVEHRYGKEELVNIENHVNKFWLDKCISIPDLDLSFKLANRLTEFLGELGFLTIRPFINVQRQYTGVSLAEHHDQGHDIRVKFASVLYLNEDFTDGELYFPDKNLSYRFPEKSLVIFAEVHDFVHRV
jgi:hypothetical protein